MVRGLLPFLEIGLSHGLGGLAAVADARDRGIGSGERPSSSTVQSLSCVRVSGGSRACVIHHNVVFS